MPLLKDGTVVEDAWQAVADAEPLPETPAIVSFKRWQAERETLAGRRTPLGVRLPNGQDVAALVPDLDRFAVIVLEFPRFNDGRAYSQARLLRERHGFKGEIRATGMVLRDQLMFMQRCGVDAFEIAKGEPVAAWQAAVREFDVFYQPTGDGRPWAQRQRAGA